MCVAIFWFTWDFDVFELVTKSSLGFFIVWSATSEYVFHLIGLSSSWVTILIDSIFVHFYSTWMVMCEDFDTSFVLSSFSLFFKDFLSFLSFLICINNFSLWSLRQVTYSFLLAAVLSSSLCIFCITFLLSWEIIFEISCMSSSTTESSLKIMSCSVIFFFVGKFQKLLFCN